MKNTLFFSLLVVMIATIVPTGAFGQCSEDESACYITIEGSSYSGTSWYGAWLEIWQDTVLRGSFVLGEAESYRADTVGICSGDSISFLWHKGMRDGYCSFTAYYADGTILFDNYIPTGNGPVVNIATKPGYCPACPRPSGLNANAWADRLDLSWQPQGNEMSWIVTVDTDIYVVSAPSLSVSGLSHGTTYDVSVRALCVTGDTSAAAQASFATMEMVPTDTLPFVSNFDSPASDALWYLFNGDFGPTHQHFSDIWVINALPSDTAEHGRTLYITDDAYNKPNHHQTPWMSCPYALTVLELDRGEYDFSFDWRANGNLNSYGCNYLRAAIVPTTVLNLLYTATRNTLPSEYIPLDGGTVLTGVTDWNTREGYFSVRQSGYYRMVFFWYNMSDTLQPPASIDNVSISQVSCPSPVDLVLIDSTIESLTIKWTPIGTESEWLVDYGEGYVAVYDTVYTIYGLTRNTSYTVCVRALCDNGDTSRSTCRTFTTLPRDPNDMLPFYCDFESAEDSIIWFYRNDGQRSQWYSGAAANNTLVGSKALYISADSGATNSCSSSESNSFAYVLLSLETGTYQYGFDWRCYGVEYNSVNRAYMLAAIVPAETPIAAGMPGSWYTAWSGSTSHPQNAIALDGGQALNSSAEWQNREGFFRINSPGMYKMVFFWHNESATVQQPAAVDNIYLRLASCDVPDSLKVIIDSTKLVLSWQPQGDENQWAVKMNGERYVTTDTFYVFNNLRPGTYYNLGVRSLCSEFDSSAAVYTEVYTDCGTVLTFPYLEDFGDDHWRQCWSMVNNGEQHNNWMASNHFQFDYTNNGSAVHYNVSYSPDDDWLVSPPLRLQGATGYNLSWRASGNPYLSYVDHLTVVVIDGYGDDFTFVDTVFSGFLGNAIESFAVNLSSYVGQTIRVAFIHDGIACRLYVDDVAVEPRPTCPQPIDLSVFVAEHSIDFSWTPDGDETQWEVSDGTQTAIVNVPNYTFQSLQAGTTYTLAVRAICSPGDTSHYSTLVVTTLLHPAVESLPYYCDYSDSEAYNWVMVGDSSRNNWYVGSAAYFGVDDTMGMYVSSDLGVHNIHSRYPDVLTYISACRTFNLAAGDYNMSFYWRNSVYSTYGYLRVFLIPLRYELQNGVNPTLNGVVPLGSVTLADPVGMEDEWTDFYREFTLPDSGQYNLVFAWYNCGGGWRYYVGDSLIIIPEVPDNQYPAAIDNVSLRFNTCPIINHLSQIGMGLNSVEIDWSYANASEFEVEYGPKGYVWGTGTRMITSTHPVVLTGLDSVTSYDVWVRPVCGQGDTGSQKKVEVSTGFCDSASIESIGVDNNPVRTRLMAPVNNYTLTEVIVDNSELYPGMVVNGMHLYYDSDTPMQNDTIVDIYLQPTAVNSFSYDNSYIALDSVTSVHVYHGSFSDFERGWNSIVFDEQYVHSGSVNMLVIMVRNSHHTTQAAWFKGERCETAKSMQCGSYSTINPNVFTMGAMHSLNVVRERPSMMFVSCNQSDCQRPEALYVSEKGYDYATLQWSGSANNYRITVRAADSTTWRDEVVVGTNSYTVAGLHSACSYLFRVRSECSDAELSAWTSLYFSTDTLPCYAPSELHVTDVEMTTATLDWTPTGEEDMWAVHVWNTSFNRVDTVDHHPYTVEGLSANTSYMYTVSALCGGGVAESEPSSTSDFTTASCPQVTAVEVTHTSATSATIIWNHVADSYQVEYGEGDFPQGAGTRVTVNNAETYNISGLTPDRNYSVYVRAVCGGNLYGLWSPRVVFKTTSVGIDPVDPQSSSPVLSVTPNPSNGQFTISVANFVGDVSLLITDITGHVLSESKIQNSKSKIHNSSSTFSVLRFPFSVSTAGVYFVRATDGRSSVVKKIVVK